MFDLRKTQLVPNLIYRKLNECTINFQNAGIVLMGRRYLFPRGIKKKILTHMKAVLLQGKTEEKTILK